MLLAGHGAAASAEPDVAKHSKPAAAVRTASSATQSKDADPLERSMHQRHPATSLHGTQQLLVFR
jgi:hypothetical protein